MQEQVINFSGIAVSIAGSALAIVGSMIAMMIWVRSEANSDRRQADVDRKETRELIYSIQLEIKDFHNRLCEIEKQRFNLTNTPKPQ